MRASAHPTPSPPSRVPHTLCRWVHLGDALSAVLRSVRSGVPCAGTSGSRWEHPHLGSRAVLSMSLQRAMRCAGCEPLASAAPFSSWCGPCLCAPVPPCVVAAALAQAPDARAGRSGRSRSPAAPAAESLLSQAGLRVPAHLTEPLVSGPRGPPCRGPCSAWPLPGAPELLWAGSWRGTAAATAP